MKDAEIHTRLVKILNNLSYVTYSTSYVLEGNIQVTSPNKHHRKELEEVRDSLNTILVSTDKENENDGCIR